ncbi:MAG: hypothetical protein ABIG43_03695 [Chloroflexota bacterium]
MIGFISTVALVIALLSAYYARKSYNLTTLLGEEKMNPQLQVSLREFSNNVPVAGAALASIEAINYSSFPALDVWCDVKFGGADWIGDWCKAKMQALENKGDDRTPEECTYLSSLKQNLQKISKLPPKDSHYIKASGVIPKDICDIARVDNVFPIHVKLFWRNEKGRNFEVTKKYGSYCIKVGASESFFITTEE